MPGKQPKSSILKTPADNHRPTGSGEGRNGVLIMEVGCSVEPDWALSPKQVKPACQHDLCGFTVNDLEITTASNCAC